MSEITLRHELNCSEDVFWDRCVFDEEYNRRLYLEALKFPGYKLLEQTDSDTQRFRRVQIDPPLDGLPTPVRAALGSHLRYLEDATFDRKTRRYKFKITPSTLTEKTNTTGEIWCEPLGEKRVARIARIRVEVKMFAIGSLIQDKILGDLRSSYDAAAIFTNEYVKEKGL